MNQLIESFPLPFSPFNRQRDKRGKMSNGDRLCRTVCVTLTQLYAICSNVLNFSVARTKQATLFQIKHSPVNFCIRICTVQSASVCVSSLSSNEEKNGIRKIILANFSFFRYPFHVGATANSAVRAHDMGKWVSKKKKKRPPVTIWMTGARWQRPMRENAFVAKISRGFAALSLTTATQFPVIFQRFKPVKSHFEIDILAVLAAGNTAAAASFHLWRKMPFSLFCMVARMAMWKWM